MKYFLSVSFLLAFYSFAQQEPVSDMYWNNYSYFNPSMSGVNYKHEANVFYRREFSPTLCTPPASWFLNYGINIKEKHGLGLNYSHTADKSLRSHRLKLNYNYQLIFEQNRKLVFGAGLNIDRLGREAPCGYYDSISNIPQKALFFDLGIAYYGNKLIAGLGITQLPIYRSSSSYSSSPHLTANLRYEADVFNDPKALILETRIRTDFATYMQDFNVGYNYKNKLEVGIGYRTSEVIMFNLTGILKGKYRIGYSFGHSINTANATPSGIHEFAIGLRLPN